MLVVDDDQVTRSAYASILKSIELRVETASSGEAAIEKAQALAPALILLDLNMPGMDGLDVVRSLRSNLQTRPIPVIMISAHDDRDDQREAFSAGVTAFLVKPVMASALVREVRQTLG